MKKLLLLLFVSLSFVANAQQVRNHSFRGFVEADYKLAISSESLNRAKISAVAGYQLNQNLYIGVGTGMSFFGDHNIGDLSAKYIREKGIDVPLFADFRFDWAKGKVQPFVDFRAGKYMTHHGGAYIDMGFGLRFPINEIVALNLTLSHVYEGLQFTSADGTSNEPGTGLALRFGVEF